MHRVPFFLVFLILVSSLVAQPSGPEPAKQVTIEDFAQALAANGLPVEEKQPKIPGFFSAVDGLALKIAGQWIEVYEYDLTVKSGAAALAKYADEGVLGRRVLVRRNLLLFEEKKHPRWREVEGVFNGL